MEQIPGGWKIAAVHLTLKAKVPGLDDAKFQGLAKGTKETARSRKSSTPRSPSTPNWFKTRNRRMNPTILVSSWPGSSGPLDPARCRNGWVSPDPPSGPAPTGPSHPHTVRYRSTPPASRLQPQLAPLQHVVHMRQHLAKCEPGLMRVQCPSEQERHDLRHRPRPLAARRRDLPAPSRVVLDQFVNPVVQPMERQPMPRQHQHIRIDRPPCRLQRRQINPQRIQPRLHRMHAHIR